MEPLEKNPVSLLLFFSLLSPPSPFSFSGKRDVLNFFFYFGGFISSYMSSIYVGLISLENCLFVCLPLIYEFRFHFGVLVSGILNPSIARATDLSSI